MSSPAHDALDRLARGPVDPAPFVATVRERLDTLTGQVEQLTRERSFERHEHQKTERRAEAAEAENARLTEGLIAEMGGLGAVQNIAAMSDESYERIPPHAKARVDRARALLAASPTGGEPGANVLTREFDAADFTGAEEHALEVIGAHRAALVAFANMMARELAANTHKDSHPLSGDFDHLLSELRGHVEKFAADPTEEHAADVANLAMLALAASSPPPGDTAPPLTDEDYERAKNDMPEKLAEPQEGDTT